MAVPAPPACLLEPLWDQFAAILPIREEFGIGHPLGWPTHHPPPQVIHLPVGPRNGAVDS